MTRTPVGPLLSALVVLLAGGEALGQSSRLTDSEMSQGRFFHAASRLPDGRVLLTHGLRSASGPFPFGNVTCELFDATDESFAIVPCSTAARARHRSLALADGRVLVLGLDQFSGSPGEFVDVVGGGAGSRVLAPGTTATRFDFSLTPLLDGRALIVGGASALDGPTVTEAEIFDPADDSFVSAGTIAPRKKHAAVRLADGRVLLAGGQPDPDSAEIFDPATGQFMPTGDLVQGREDLQLTLLPDGDVLATGGSDGASRDTAELYDPETGQFTLLPDTMTTPREDHAALLLDDGLVLIAGGEIALSQQPLAAAELYDPQTQTFMALDDLQDVRDDSSFTLLADGRVLIAGGETASAVGLRSAELWQPCGFDPADCGCPGDVDSDGDTLLDCEDGCPDDADKDDAGACGCGRPEVDADGDGVVDCGCAAADLHPEFGGDGRVDLRDWMIGRAKAFLGTVPVRPADADCADLAPGALDCDPPAWRATGDGAFDLTDVVALRPVAAGLWDLVAEPCLGDATEHGADRRRPGDVVPVVGTDGSVDVTDVVSVLRFAVHLDAPTAEQLLRGDVAPVEPDGALSVVRGSGDINVGDVVVLLRATVAFDVLAWPERNVELTLADGAGVTAASVLVTGWPAWAEMTGTDGLACTEAGGGGLDEAGGRCAYTCASDAPLAAAATLARFRYRSAEAVDAGALEVEAQLADDSLRLVAGAVTVGAP